MGKKRTLKWLLWLAWVVGGLYFADKGASYYRQARALPRSAIEAIPEMPPHRAGDRVLVFAPHPDDEALGCAGVIQQALSAGAQVWVVYMTNGDGFRLAVEQHYRQPKPTPEQHILFGEMRQQEARRAMHLLGLADWRITFLGYPDRGLYLLWQSNWTPSNALRSYYTDTDSNPYRDTLRPGSTYCGQNVLRDVETVLRRTVPTHVYVTHPADDHPDHAATALFVQTALARLRLQGIGFAQRVVLRHYLVHCGDWPQPQGLHPDEPLTPPSAFFNIGLHWKRLSLTPQQQMKKLKAIRSHNSQMLMMSRFLQSFVRQNELFIEQPVTMSLKPAHNTVWEEPDEEDFLRELQSPGDFSWGVLQMENGQLILHLSTRGKPRTGFTYTCTAHVLLPDGNITTITLRAKIGKHSVSAQVNEDGVTFRFPAPPSGSLVTLHAQSRFAGLPVDKTIGRVIRLP
ncbi:1D-myo-inositol 2-acetamido-2-deoxy-alpha-D-glucopyranoside deacetylase [bacterium HR16]|nr:1D-myo-inositol 2-acetamido-2-deoxy-alpha-D-glucopyranoside deacetylase [bacterium HR16]